MPNSQNESVEKQNTFVQMLLSALRIALIAGLIIYVLYHLTGGFSAEMKTETVRIYNEEVSVNVTGAVVRSEKVVENSLLGVVNYRFANGERVGVNSEVATVYSEGQNAETIGRIAELDKSIELLDGFDFDEEISVSDGIAAGHEISDRLFNVSYSLGRGDFAAVLDNKEPILKSQITRSIALGDGGEAAKGTLSELRSERSTLVSSLGGQSSTVRTKYSGYFYDSVDGGEDAFDYASVKELTPSSYRECMQNVGESDPLAVGKIVTSPRWYFACPVKTSEAANLKVGKKYDIDFAESDMRIQMTLDAKNEEGDELLLVFTTNVIPSGFDFGRVQKASIVKETVSGYRVPSSSLRVVDSTVGVYIRSGNTVKFRVADVIYESGAYSFVSTDTEGKTLYADDADAENDVYCKGLSLYDNVIVSGAKELTPDRIVN